MRYFDVGKSVIVGPLHKTDVDRNKLVCVCRLHLLLFIYGK